MSSQAERGLGGQSPAGFVIPEGTKRFFQEEVEKRLESPEFPNGLWFPLSGVLEDSHRDDGTKFSSRKIFPTVHGVFTAILDVAERNNTTVQLRGSTWAYKLLNASGVERRGTVSQAVNGALSPAIEKFNYTKSAQALGALAHASDWDLVLPDVTPDEFSEKNGQILNSIHEAIGARLTTHPRKSGGSSYPTRKVKYRNKWFGENSENMVCSEDSGTVAGGKVPFGEITLATKKGSKLTNIFWTSGSLGEVDGLIDTRLDPDFALSWDSAAVGEVRRELDNGVGMISRVAGDMALFLGSSPTRRHISELGVFPSAEYAEGSDIWFYLPKENVDMLTSPIEVGPRFREMPALEQFKLALRACQKGALSEENLTVVSENVAPALSRNAKDAFCSIDEDLFRQEYLALSPEDRTGFESEVMRDMMLGLFYPEKFLTYFREAGLSKFFPQLKNITDQEFLVLIDKLPEHDVYSKRQYAASHYTETVATAGIDQQIELTRKHNSLANPYHLLFRTMLQYLPHITPNVRNSFEAIDILFNLDYIASEPVDDKHFTTINVQKRMTRGAFTEVDIQPKSGNAFDDFIHGQAREIKMEEEITKQQMKIRAAQLAAACLGGIIFLASQEVGFASRLGAAGEIGGAVISLSALTSYFTRRIAETLRFLDEEDRELGLWDHEIEKEDFPKG